VLFAPLSLLLLGRSLFGDFLFFFPFSNAAEGKNDFQFFFTRAVGMKTGSAVQFFPVSSSNLLFY